MPTAIQVASKACYKLVADMLYEARIQAVIDYKAKIERVRIYKGPARDLRLTREQYLRVPPWWIANDYPCWEMIVDRWCSQKWLEMHEAARQQRLMMPGASHHQDNRNLKAYVARYSASHGGVPCSQVQAYCLAHKRKATSDVTFNPQDPPEVYSNASVHSRLSGYTSMAQEVHGPEFDAINEPIDGEVVMRAGGGKKHGRYWFGDNLVDTATTPTLVDSSQEYQLKPCHTPTARHYTGSD